MARPLSILLVLHDFALGGTERIAVRLAGAWVAAGVEVTIFCGAAAGPLAGLLDPRIAVVPADPPVTRARGSRRTLAGALARWLRTGGARFDGAFVPGNFHWPLVPVLARAGLPVLAQVSAALTKPQRGAVRQRLFDARLRRLLGPAAAVVTLFDAARDRCDRLLGHAVARTIPLPALDDDAPPPVPAGGDHMILAAGRLVPEKGFATLIAAFAQVRDPAARLVIVGEGPDRPRLERCAERLGVADRVVLPGYAADVRPWLNAARMFVLSSRFEGYPAVLVEALAAGRAVVATACTPATALLPADAAVPIDDAPALAHAIERTLAAPPPDPARLAASVAHHRIGQVARAYLALFAEIRR